MLIGILLIASITDLYKSKIPNYITLPGIGIGIIYLVFVSRQSLWEHLVVCSILLILTLPLFAIKAMGAGDIKLMVMIALFMEPKGVLLSLILGLGLSVIYTFTKLLVSKGIRERILYLKDYLYALSNGFLADGYIPDDEKKDSKDYNVHLSIWITIGVVITWLLGI